MEKDNYKILDLYGGRGAVGKKAHKRIPNRNIEYTLIDANAIPRDFTETDLFHPNIIRGAINDSFQGILDKMDDGARDLYDEIHLHMPEAMCWEIQAPNLPCLENEEIPLTDIQTIEEKLKKGGMFYHTFQGHSPFYPINPDNNVFRNIIRNQDYSRFMKEVVDVIKEGTEFKTEEAWLMESMFPGRISYIKVGENEIYNRNEGKEIRADRGYSESVGKLFELSDYAPLWAQCFIKLKK